MSLMEALQTCIPLLTVGDGLVSQIPALLISTATGIIVTHIAAEKNMGSDVVTQMTVTPRALMIVSAMPVGFAPVPGLPKVPFLLISAVMGAAHIGSTNKKLPSAWMLNSKQKSKQKPPHLRRNKNRLRIGIIQPRTFHER